MIAPVVPRGALALAAVAVSLAIAACGDGNVAPRQPATALGVWGLANIDGQALPTTVGDQLVQLDSLELFANGVFEEHFVARGANETHDSDVTVVGSWSALPGSFVLHGGGAVVRAIADTMSFDATTATRTMPRSGALWHFRRR